MITNLNYEKKYSDIFYIEDNEWLEIITRSKKNKKAVSLKDIYDVRYEVLDNIFDMLSIVNMEIRKVTIDIFLDNIYSIINQFLYKLIPDIAVDFELEMQQYIDKLNKKISDVDTKDFNNRQLERFKWFKSFCDKLPMTIRCDVKQTRRINSFSYELVRLCKKYNLVIDPQNIFELESNFDLEDLNFLPLTNYLIDKMYEYILNKLDRKKHDIHSDQRYKEVQRFFYYLKYKDLEPNEDNYKILIDNYWSKFLEE